MKKNKLALIGMAFLLLLLSAVLPLAGELTAWAADLQVYSEKIPHGKTGKSLTVSLK